jgi:hypothetical protein
MHDYLSIYLNDQLALGVLWREVARRAAQENSGTEVGDAVGQVATAIAEDVETFERIMQRLEVRRSPLKARRRLPRNASDASSRMATSAATRRSAASTSSTS